MREQRQMKLEKGTAIAVITVERTMNISGTTWVILTVLPRIRLWEHMEPIGDCSGF